jgi:hypothetical protein
LTLILTGCTVADLQSAENFEEKKVSRIRNVGPFAVRNLVRSNRRFPVMARGSATGNNIEFEVSVKLFVEVDKCQLTGNICHDTSHIQAPQILGNISRIQGLT